MDEFRNFLTSGEGAIVAEQIKQFNIDFGVLDGVLPDALASGERVERTTANGLKVPSIVSRAARDAGGEEGFEDNLRQKRTES